VVLAHLQRNRSKAVTGWPRSRRRSWGWHRHCLSGGTTIPRAVPTWPRSRAAEKGLSPDTTMYTAGCMTVHRRGLSGATVAFYPRAAEVGLVTAGEPPCPRRCTALFFQRPGLSWGWPRCSSPPLGWWHRHPSPMTNY
jgi:hypothetical protein